MQRNSGSLMPEQIVTAYVPQRGKRASAFGINLINRYNKKLRYNSSISNIVNNVILLYCVYKGLSTKTALLT